MRKIISLFLTATLVAGCLTAGITAFAEDDNIGIALASDLHYNLPSESLYHDIDDDIFFYGNRRAAMEEESGFIIDEFLNQCAEDDSVEYVLISGDLADNGRTTIEEHYNVAEKLEDFEEKTGKPVYITNGNHDTGAAEGETTNEMFREIYWNFGYSEAIDTDEGTLSYTVNLGSKYRLIVADSCDPSVSTEDGLTSDRVSWICDEAEKAYDEGRYPILMMHHNLLDHMPVQRVLSHNFIVRNHLTTAEKLANAGIKTVFTGHEHGSDVTYYTSTIGNKIYDFSTTSLTMYPLEYRFINFTGEKITYESRSIDSIDFDALTSTIEGYTDEQINLMKSDFTEYSKEYFKACIQYRLWLGFTPEKLGVPEDEFYSDIVYTAVNGLTDTLEEPLYGSGSVQEQAEEYNIDIPDSDYENGWDLITEILSYHYAGDEPYTMDSPEITILFRLVDFVLLDVLSDVNDKCFLSAANEIMSDFGTETICKDFTKSATDVFGPVTAGEYFILAIASPILSGLVSDRDGIPDNDGSIDGYAAETSKTASVSENISSIFERIITYLRLYFSFIFKIFAFD